MRRMQSGLAAALLLTAAVLVGPAPWARSQPPGDSASTAPTPDETALIQKVYEKTKTAKSLEEYSEIVRLCEQERSAKLSPAGADYLKRLSSWARNRRGEAYAERAARLADEGRDDASAKLDVLALKDFEAAVENNPSYWKAIHNRGVSYALAGQFEKAIQDFNRTVDLKPDYANAWFNRGEIRYELGQYEEAVADYNQALRIDADDAKAHISRGHAYFQLKRFREALADYDEAVRLDGQDADARADRGDAYQSLGRWREAAADYRRAIELDPKLGRAYQSAAWLMATCPDESIRNADLAVETAKKAIELSGEKNHYDLDALAAACANAGRFDEAQAALAKAIQAAPAEAVERLKKRLALYEAETPFRQQQPAAERPATPQAPK